jgi:DNA-directed RNA polymerase sigma subunit (sigma70/sigma32)
VAGIGPGDDAPEAVFRRRLRALDEAPLMTTGEELAAAARVADGRAADMELAGRADEPAPDPDEIAVLHERLRCGETARATLIAASRRLVVSLARRHRLDATQSSALLVAGDAALARAVDRYDPAGGLPFSAFARWWVERAMREVERHPAGPVSTDRDPSGPSPADSTLLTALGHLHHDDCRIIELRLGLNGGPALSTTDTARVLGVTPESQAERERRALAKLRHPCTPGDLTDLREL